MKQTNQEWQIENGMRAKEEREAVDFTPLTMTRASVSDVCAMYRRLWGNSEMPVGSGLFVPNTEYGEFLDLTQVAGA